MNLIKLSLAGFLGFSLLLFCSGCTEIDPEGNREIGISDENETLKKAANEKDSLAEGKDEAAGEKKAESQILVAVSILPQAEFVEAVGGDKVKPIVMIPPGASPATHEPTPGQLKAISAAQMYAMVGSGLAFEEVWLDKLKAVNQEMLLVDCSKGITLRDMETSFSVAASKSGEAKLGFENMEKQESKAEAPHFGKDPHIWNSPINAKVMVENIYQGLQRLDPENESYYRQNRDAYLFKLETLDAKIRKELEGQKNRTFMVFHPSWGYFADEYGLLMLPLEIEGKEPSGQNLARVITLAKEKNIKVIFIQSQFSTRSAEAVAEEIGGEVVAVDPLAQNYIENMEEVSGIFARSLI